jgi:hypothetical protein
MIRNKWLVIDIMKFEELELWDHIPGYDKYKVSSKGRVFNANSNKFRKPSLDKHGYYFVTLSKYGNVKTHFVHQLMVRTFYFMDDYEKEIHIDHADRVKTNNSLLNLRFCSIAENQRNKDIQRNNTSGYKGVSWDKARQKWLAKIKINGKTKNLGRFVTKEEAYEAYKEASKEHHGDFGYTP